MFSVSPTGEVWPFATYGYTHDSERYRIDDSPLLDTLADAILKVRPEGGRVFVNDVGVFVQPLGQPAVHVVEFERSEALTFQWVNPNASALTRSQLESPRAAHEAGRCAASTCHCCREEVERREQRKRVRQLDQMADELLGVSGRPKKRWQR